MPELIQELTPDELLTLQQLTTSRLRKEAEAVIRADYEIEIETATAVNKVAVTDARAKRNAALAALDA